MEVSNQIGHHIAYLYLTHKHKTLHHCDI